MRKRSVSLKNNLIWIVRLGVVALLAGSIWMVANVQRESAAQSAREAQVANDLLVGALDQETGFRGYVLSAEEEFLDPYKSGAHKFTLSLNEARHMPSATPQQLESLDRQRELLSKWVKLAEFDIQRIKRGAQNIDAGGVDERKALIDQFRIENANYQKLIAVKTVEKEKEAILILVSSLILLSLIGLLISHLVIDRPQIRLRQFEREQNELKDALQVANSEQDAYEILKRFLERAIGGAQALIMNKNNSKNRLEPMTSGSELKQDLLSLTSPETCLSIRRAAPYKKSSNEKDPLIECQICGKIGENVRCVPTLIGGEIIGAALVYKEDTFSSADDNKINQAVSHAAPVLANLRTIRIAEKQAATDPLTGLANPRSAHDHLVEMFALAESQNEPLSVVMIDLDHFKSINDRYGHPTGDTVLAAAARHFKGGLRAKDFVARFGGEEFVLFLPNTPEEGARVVSESLRESLQSLYVPTYPGRLAASFGIATYPQDALDEDSLLQEADKALYKAKETGRNRVIAISEINKGKSTHPKNRRGADKAPAKTPKIPVKSAKTSAKASSNRSSKTTLPKEGSG